MADTRTKSGSAKKMAFLVVIVLAFVLFLAGYIAMQGKGGSKPVAKGDLAPEFRLPALDGRQVGLADFRGRVVMVHFWATWCPPCVEELPTLASLSQELKGAEFELLAVSVDEGGAAAVSSFLKKSGLALPVLLDPDRSVAHAYGTYKFPETYIVDRQGFVREKIIGARDWRDPAALDLLWSMLASQ